MLTFTQLRNLYGSLTNNTEANNLTLGDVLINQAQKNIVNSHSWYFTEKSRNATTVASQQNYELPVDYKKLNDVFVLVGTTRYVPLEVPHQSLWDNLNQTNFSSNFPEWYLIRGSQILFWPTPSTTGNVITYNYEIKVRDLSIADYTTGTILTATNGSKIVTGTVTAWTVPMAGRFIRITESNTANTGDGQWYEVATVNSVTQITLVKNYQGTSIVAGTAAYTLGQMPVLPDGYHEMMPFKAAEIYWSTLDEKRSAYFRNYYNEMHTQLLLEHGNKTTNPAVSTTEVQIINPNLTITLP